MVVRPPRNEQLTPVPSMRVGAGLTVCIQMDVTPFNSGNPAYHQGRETS